MIGSWYSYSLSVHKLIKKKNTGSNKRKENCKEVRADKMKRILHFSSNNNDCTTHLVQFPVQQGKGEQLWTSNRNINNNLVLCRLGIWKKNIILAEKVLRHRFSFSRLPNKYNRQVILSYFPVIDQTFKGLKKKKVEKQ